MDERDITIRKIDRLVWMALTDESFCQDLLNGQRSEILKRFGFSEEERQAVLAVEADTLESFAGALCQQRFSRS